MTLWRARRRGDEDRQVLCGYYTSPGRFPCGGLIAVIFDERMRGYGREVRFPAVYKQARPIVPGETLPLEFTSYAAGRRDEGRPPAMRRLVTATDGTEVLLWKAWPLPVSAPCPRCGRMNIVPIGIDSESDSQ